MYKNVEKYIFAVGVGILGGVIIKKLDNIQAEIEYFEREKGIYLNRKQHEKRTKEYWKKRDRA